MDKILERISSYNIFNNLLPGAVFCLAADNFLSIPLIQSNVINGLFLYYFYGLVISRFGSLILEPILKKGRMVNFSSYSDFVIASKNDPKIELLSEVNNMYRTILAMITLLLITAAYELFLNVWPQVAAGGRYIAIIALLFLFFFSYKKQTEYINKRISTNKTP